MLSEKETTGEVLELRKSTLSLQTVCSLQEIVNRIYRVLISISCTAMHFTHSILIKPTSLGGVSTIPLLQVRKQAYVSERVISTLGFEPRPSGK